MVKSILAVADAGPTLAAMLATTRACADHLGAAVDAVHVRDSTPIMVGMPEATIVIHARDIEKWAGQRAAEAQAAYAKAMAGANSTWIEEEGPEAQVLADHARVSDLAVIMRPGSDPEKPSPGYVNALLFESGRSVLVAPPTPGKAFKNVVIAWNGSLQAARAIGQAIPFLQRAASVLVLTMKAQGSEAPTDRLIQYLARHGITARVEIADPGRVSARKRGKFLLGFVDSMQADLLVMGAYGQGRVMQFLGLGGATAKVITANKMPVLLAN